MEADQPKISIFYKFGAFVLNANEHLLTQDGEQIPLPPKAFALLVLLVEKPGSLLKKETLLESIWPEVTVEEGNVPYNVSLVRKALGDTATNPQFIATVPRIGYRFIAEVQKCSEDATLQTADKIDRNSESADYAAQAVADITIDRNHRGREVAETIKELLTAASPAVKHYRHLLVVSFLYALYFSVAFLLEIAYQYDNYRNQALRVTPLIFLWVAGSSIIGLRLGLKRTSEGKQSGLLLSLTIFFAAAFLLYLITGNFLPNVAITQATFQTYPAHGAFLKSIYYIMPLIILFVVVPSHFVVAIENRHLEIRSGESGQLSDLGVRANRVGTIYLKLWWLAFILLCAFLLALVGMSHLFDNLKPNPNLGFFVQLAQWKFILYFLLGLECLLWYQHAKSQISRQFATPLGASF
jgi:DNA-binding winged helix-turn-helix (wHTH) protein/uncharacterized protein with PQ loop repeat